MEGINLAVVNYRSPDDLQHFLMSVEKHPPTIPWSLAVVNVDPQPRDENVAQRYVTRSNGQITSLTFEENVGYAKAVNRAALLGDLPVFACFNADTRVTANVLDACYAALQSREEWAVLGPRQIDDYGKITHGGIFKDGERGFHQANLTEFADIRDDALTVSGSAYFIKRSVWDELTCCEIYQKHTGAEGAFLPTKHYWEETWASYHARNHGYKVVYYGDAYMMHKWHGASPLYGWAERQITRSREMFRDMCDLHGIEHD